MELIDLPYYYHNRTRHEPARLVGWHTFNFILPFVSGWPRYYSPRLELECIRIEWHKSGAFKAYHLNLKLQEWLDTNAPGWELFVWTNSFDLNLREQSHALAFKLKWLAK